MALTERYKVGNFVFTTAFGTGFVDGLSFDPSVDGTGSPEWTAALGMMLERYPVILAFMSAEYDCDMAIHNYPDSRESLATAMQSVASVQARDDFDLLPTSNKERLSGLMRACIDHASAQSQPKPAAKKRRENWEGYVYLLQSPTSAYKIGRAKDPANRAKTFGVQLPFEVEFIALIKTDDMYALELELHTQYADKRINGEWFNLDAADVETIKSMAVRDE
jgi:hypothetical protein